MLYAVYLVSKEEPLRMIKVQSVYLMELFVQI